MEKIFRQLLNITPPQLKPIYDVVEYPKSVWPTIIFVVVAGIALVILGLCCWKKYILNKADQERVPPQVLAMQAIDTLLKSELLSSNQVEIFFTELSKIIRVYIEARFTIHAPDMTTEEFLISVQEDQKLTDTDKKNLKEFMEICDQIKFAKFSPDKGTIEKLTKVAREFIQTTGEKEKDDA